MHIVLTPKDAGPSSGYDPKIQRPHVKARKRLSPEDAAKPKPSLKVTKASVS